MTNDKSAEEWRPIAGFQNLYEVSNLGNIISLFGGKKTLKKQGWNYQGYRKVNLADGSGRGKNVFVHVLIAEAFLGPRNGKMVNHLDGNKSNNILSNLEYTTNRENSFHYYNSQNPDLPVGINKEKNANSFTFRFGYKGEKYKQSGYRTAEDAHAAMLRVYKFMGIENKYANTGEQNG